MKFTISVSMCPPEQLLPVAVAAEQAGWYGITIGESVFFPEKVDAKYPYTDDGSRFWSPGTPFVDPWVAIPAMAAVTSRLFFHTSVIKLPLRSPLLVAKTVGSAAALSGDRVGLGVGLSWIPQEFAWCGTSWADRGPRTDEMIDALRVIWASDVASFNGRYVAFDGVVSRPRTVRAAGVPIHVGGRSRAAAARAGRLGDGFHPIGLEGDDLTDALQVLWESAVQAGRDPDAIELTLGARLDPVDDGHIEAAIAAAAGFGAARLVVSTHERRLDDARTELERFAERHLG